MQIRVVLTVYRSETDRLRHVYPGDEGAQGLERLRSRSIDLLDDARARLDGEGPTPPELLEELSAARSEVGGEPDRALEAALSPGSPGDRRG